MSRSTSTKFSMQGTLSVSAATGRPTLTRSVAFKRMTVTVGGRNAWQLLFDRKLLLLIPLLFYSGLQSAYISADFTRYVVQPLLKTMFCPICILLNPSPLLGAQWMGGAMMVFGVAIAVVSALEANLPPLPSGLRFAHGLAAIRLMLMLGAAAQITVLVLTWVFQTRMQRAGIGARGAALPAVSSASSQALTLTRPFPPPKIPHGPSRDASYAPWSAWSSTACCLHLLPLMPPAILSLTPSHDLLPSPLVSLTGRSDAAYAHWIAWSSAACSAYFLASPYIATPIKNSLLLVVCPLSVMLAAVAVKIRPPGQAKPCEGV
ncbi:unnamed protein product [Closterium sp. Naga37s-1]|nr:unnamed protein product [Closterium sp. Naga37s-1]